MRTTFLSLSLPALGFMVCLLTLTPNATAQTNPKEALLAVMRAKTEAYYVADIQKWQSFWLQDSSSSRTVLSKFGYESHTGWPSVVAAITKNSQEDGVHPATVTYENVHIRTSGKLAYVEADERGNWPGSTSQSSTRTYTVLVNEKKSWKIANQVRVAPDSYAPTPLNREYELNVIGYDLMRDKRISEAIAVFGVNVRLNPDSWNAYDSLGEAYALSGDTVLAIANYEKSLALNPENRNAKTVLDTLKKGIR